VIQIPIAAYQLVAFGQSDPVQGTLYGAGAGAHVISAVCVVGGIWILYGGGGGIIRYPWRLLVALPLFLIPFVADAKQVILAAPAILVVTTWRQGPVMMLLKVAAVSAAVVGLLVFQPAGETATGFLEGAQEGRGGKAEAARFVWERLDQDPASVAFGLGPAESVSRAAFMTTDLLLSSDSPLRVLGLRPATVAQEVQVRALEVSGGGTSFNSSLSSALGVVGDLGVIGLGIYLVMLTALIIRLRRLQSPEGVAAAAGFAMFALLGLVFDWWEQPPFGMTLAVLAGLALTGERGGDHVP
jgi:hypothetical protein